MGLAPQAVDEINDNVHRAVVLNFEAFPIDGNVEEVVMAAPGMPDDGLLERERCSYLVDAVASLPERLRRVVIGYFLEELPMQTLADELRVTESRISQMRAEALGLLRDGINSQLDPDMVDHRPEANRVTKRKVAYYTAIATELGLSIQAGPSIGVPRHPGHRGLIRSAAQCLRPIGRSAWRSPLSDQVPGPGDDPRAVQTDRPTVPTRQPSELPFGVPVPPALPAP